MVRLPEPSLFIVTIDIEPLEGFLFVYANTVPVGFQLGSALSRRVRQASERSSARRYPAETAAGFCCAAAVSAQTCSRRVSINATAARPTAKPDQRPIGP